MLATTALIAVGRKVSDSRARKKEERQGLLNVGDSSIARKAFAAQAGAITNRGLTSSGENIKFEDPSQIRPDSAYLSPVSDTSTQADDEPNRRSRSDHPPPYSSPTDTSDERTRELALVTTSSPSLSPSSPAGTDSISLKDPNAVRVRTNGTDLKSGFPYHPALFDLQVRPDAWQTFTEQIIESTKFSLGDHAQIWAASTSVALTGAFITSVWLGRSLNRNLQEKKVKKGLQDSSAGSLGETLQQWNEEFFVQHGLFVTLELGDASKQKPTSGSTSMRKHYLLHKTRGTREQKKEDRKFVIVVSRISACLETPTATQDGVQELPADGDATKSGVPAELPCDEREMPAELPAATISEIPDGCFELPAELPAFVVSGSKEREHTDDDVDQSHERDEGFRPAPLMVRSRNPSQDDPALTAQSSKIE